MNYALSKLEFFFSFNEFFFKCRWISLVEFVNNFQIILMELKVFLWNMEQKKEKFWNKNKLNGIKQIKY